MGCWVWNGATSRGYGYASVEGRNRLVHRTAYEVLVGPIPEGLELDHLCRIKTCYNPAHLEPVTHAENVRRGDLAKANSRRALTRTTCPEGHPYVYVMKDGSRRCRPCIVERNRRLRERKRNDAASS